MSDPWRHYRGPYEWFQLRHPPSWEHSESDGAIRLLAPDGVSSLILFPFWRAEWPAGGLEAAVEVGQLFPEHRGVRVIKPLGIESTSIGFEGEARFPDDTAWWKRPFKSGHWRRWRRWAVRQGAVGLLAVFVPTDDCDPETQTLATMILNTLSFADDPADPPQVFADRVLALARQKFPLLDCETAEEFQLRVGGSNLNLFNFYRQYVKSPDKFAEIVLPALTTIVQVQEWGHDQTHPAFEDVRGRILPMLYPQHVWQERFPNFIGMPWVAGLIVLYVVDEAQAYWYVREDLLAAWNLTRDELHELALANLDTYFENNPIEFLVAGSEENPQLLIPGTPNAYNSCRVLSESFHGRLRELLGGQFGVGLPGRDFFVAFRLGDEAAVAQVRRQVGEDFARMDHPLSDRLLLVTPDGVCELLDE
ncbi:MAG TPA: DUF1444 family protein [Planctomycetaceae bacterium]|nr:DUF1444 family protein [Planctomycetaceae bacterium]